MTVTRLSHEAFSRDIALDQDKLSSLVIRGLADIPKKLQEFGIIDNTSKGPVVSTVLGVSAGGEVGEAFLSMWSKKTKLKVPANRLFPQAPVDAKLSFPSFELQSFEFPPSSYFSKWTRSTDLNVQVMKTNSSDDGFYDKAEWAGLGIRDFIVRANVVPRDEPDVVDIHVVAIPIPMEELSSLPGDTKADGYPCVGLMDKLGELAVPNLEPLRRDGLPVLPFSRSNEETPPIPDALQVLRAMYGFWSKPRVAVMTSAATWAELVKGPQAPGCVPALSKWAWPVLTENLDQESGSEEGEYMLSLHR